ncbi:keratin-associated protein 15-1 [Meriones unguiculatus]|uniref:keratin-associated protein 15-1 n=1 Tax=Meriones unguiculatus TaxID=10047 RepID=UPI000B4F6DFF|nr:keratin-associated protein 15-1 [Meriones unguiculatus]XP_055470764.1 keratin-associated protein 15-1 [Psammomys obesus]
MSYVCNSGNFSSQSFGGFLRQPVSSYNSFYPTNNVVYSPKNFQLGSSFYNGQQETFGEPLESHSPCVGTRSFQTSCFRPKQYFSSPCQGGFTGSFGYGNSGFGSFGFGNSGIRSVGCGSGFYRPGYFSSKSIQSSYYQPGFSSGFCGSAF